jgi:hypothetical protein
MERRTRGIFYRATDAEGRVVLARRALDAMRGLCDAAGRDRLDREYRATIRGGFVSVPTDERGEPIRVE